MATKQARVKKVYVSPAGEESRSWKEDSEVLRFDFLGDDGETVVESETFAPGDFPETVRAAFAFHGISQKIGDSYASALKKNIDPVEAVGDIVSRLKEGVWVERSEGAGPRTTQLVEAIVRTLEANGETVDDARRKSIGEKLQDEATRKNAMATPAIKAHLDAIRIEAAQARLEKAKAAAAEDETNVAETF